jgi:hypothetical protein
LKKIKKTLLCACLTTAFLTTNLMGAYAQPNDIKVLIQSNNYKLNKYEPTEGLYLGAYVVQDTLINGDMEKFNELTGKKHASFFRYVAYGTKVPDFWLQEIKKVGAAPHIALEPNKGLDQVQDDAYLHELAKQLNEIEGPVFLRYASEMNGTWCAYSGDPQKYIEKWRLVHDVMEKEAPNVMMLWTVFTHPQNTILTYYPGDKYVDWVGVNVYNVVYHNNNINLKATHEDPLELLEYVYKEFSERKPIQISEFGVNHYTVTDGKEYIDFAINKISRMYKGLKDKYPRIKSIFYFDVNNLINAPEGRKINNYALTDNERILNTYKGIVQDPYYLTDIGENKEGLIDPELFTVNDPIIQTQGTTFVSLRSMAKYLGFTFNIDNIANTIKIKKEQTEIVVPLTSKPTLNCAFLKNGTTYLPLKKVAQDLGYRLENKLEQGLIKVVQ